MTGDRSGLIQPGYLKEMAAHNGWQNGVVFELVDALDAAERNRDRGMFFGSLHHTLDHIVAIDLWILDTLDGIPPRRFDMKEVFHPDWDDLKAVRARLDTRIDDLAKRVDQVWLDGVIEFGRLEIAQLENAPNFPERGAIEIEMGGGK